MNMKVTCAWCDKTIQAGDDSRVSHSICSDCERKHFPHSSECDTVAEANRQVEGLNLQPPNNCPACIAEINAQMAAEVDQPQSLADQTLLVIDGLLLAQDGKQRGRGDLLRKIHRYVHVAHANSCTACRGRVRIEIEADYQALKKEDVI